MSHLLNPPLPLTPPLQETPFYGWRYLRRYDADGRETLEEVPLTLEDLLYPQEGDEIPMRPQHQIECSYLANLLRERYADDPSMAVLSDCLIDWGVAEQRNHQPDISIFRDVRTPPDPQSGTFHLVPSGGRVVLVLEVVSPDCRDNDVVRKPEDYHRLDIPLYVLIDQIRDHGPRRLHGYRWTSVGYEELPLDAGGRLFLQPVDLWLALEDGWVACYDAASETRIGDYQEIAQALREEKAARRAAELQVAAEQALRQEAARRADANARRADIAKQRADDATRLADANERLWQAAERRADAAEQLRQQEATARQAAEQLRQQEATARQAAEQQNGTMAQVLRETLEELRRLRGES